MTVKLHPLHFTVVNTLYCKVSDLPDACNRTDGQLMVEFIHHGDSFEFNECTDFDFLFQIRHLFIMCEHFNGNGIGKIRYIKNQNTFFVSDLSLIIQNNLTVNADFTHFSGNIRNLHGIIIKVSAIDNIRIV